MSETLEPEGLSNLTCIQIKANEFSSVDLYWISGIQPLAHIKAQALAKSHKVQTWSKDQNFPDLACVEGIRSDLLSTVA